MPTLIIKNLKKKFDRIWALKELNLELMPGEIFVLLGPNGAGKTTTLKLIAGLLQPTAGEIYIKNIALNSEPIKAKAMISYIPDEPFIYNKLTGREFINFIAGIQGVKKEEYELRLKRLFDRFEIGDWIDQYAETYSHGMKQKVIMCQLFIHNPELVLIDEPLVGLDPKSSKTVRELFFELSEQGKTLFICTHTLSFAEDIATRLGIINSGELQFIGSREELSKIAGKSNIEEIYLNLTE